MGIATWVKEFAGSFRDHTLADIAKKFWRNHWAESFSIFAGLGFSFLAYWEQVTSTRGRWVWSSWEARAVILIGLLFVAGNVGLIKKNSQKESALVALRKQLNATEEMLGTAERIAEGREGALYVAKTSLKVFYAALNFGYSERITLFRYVESEDVFTQIGRASGNPRFKGFPRQYKGNEGCLGKAWANGVHESPVLPDYGTDEIGYKKQSKHIYGLSNRTVDRLSMKSRRYHGIRINSADVSKKPVGVIIFETIEENFPGNEAGRSINEVWSGSGVDLNGWFAWIIDISPDESPEPNNG